MHPDLAAALKTARGDASDAAEKNLKPNAANDAWPTIDAAAFHGLAGDVVRAIDPHTEADPVAILSQFLASFGNIIGRGPHCRVEGDYHRANIFVVLVGDTSKARKGTSAGRVRSVMIHADQTWANERTKNGLSSGEGLINELRDAREAFNVKEQAMETVDPGIADKRLLIAEAEFANALAVMERPGNTLSPVMRNAWDGHTLATLTKNSPLKATGAHVSVVGHITIAELQARINRTELANGFANRYLFFCVRRSKLLPFGGSIGDDEIRELGERVRLAVKHAKTVDQITMTDGTRRAWETTYEKLSAAQPGLLGAITGRAEAQVIRLALIYALLDHTDQIEIDHLLAALAVWEYAEASAVHIFGEALGDPVADEIYRALKQVGHGGMSRTGIRDLFTRHQSAGRISAALALLLMNGRAKCETTSTGGRPSETWSAIPKSTPA